MNWGGFAGGFAQGFHNGIRMGNEIDSALKQRKLDDIRAQGIAEAKAAQQKDIEASVVENGIEAATPATAANGPELNSTPQASAAPASRPQTESVTTTPVDVPTSESIGRAPAPPLPTTSTPSSAAPATPSPELSGVPQASAKPAVMPKEAPQSPASEGIKTPAKGRFEVYGKRFETREQAIEYAKKNAPSMMDYMGKTLVPKMQEALLEQGEIEKAEAWGKWAKERQNQRHMETWAKAYTAAQRGDLDGAAGHVFELYKHYDDGVTPISKEVVKDNKGNVTGFNVKLRDDATGEERSQFVGQQELLNMGLSALSPPALFEQAYKRQAEAEKLAAEARIDAAKEAGKHRNAKELKQMEISAADKRVKTQHENKVEEIALEKRLDGQKPGEIGRKARDLKQLGWTDDEIKELLKKTDTTTGRAPHPNTVALQVYNKFASDEVTQFPVLDAQGKPVVGEDGKPKKAYFKALPKEQRNRLVMDEARSVLNMLSGAQGGEAPPPTTTPQAVPQAAPMPAPQGLKDGFYKLDGKPVRVQNGQIIPLQ